MASPVLELESLFVRIYADASQLFTTSKKVQEEMDRLARRMQQAMALFAGAAVVAFAKFDDALTRTMARMEDWKQEHRSLLEGGIFDIATKSITGPVELAKGLDILASAGMNAAMATKALGIAESFSVASGLKLETSTRKLVDIQRSFGLNMENSEDHYRVMTKLSDLLIGVSIETGSTVEQLSNAFGNRFVAAARAMNLSLEQAISLQGVYSIAGAKGASASDKAARFLHVISTLTPAHVAQWKAFGVTVFDADHNLKPLSQILGQMEERFALMSPEAATATKTLLGFTERNISSLEPLLGMSKEMKRLENRTKELGGTTEMMAEMLRRSFGSQLKILWNNITVLAIAIGSKLAPALAWVVTQIETLTKAFKDLNPAIQNLIVIFLGLFVAIRPVVFILRVLLSNLMFPFALIASPFIRLIQVFTTLIFLPSRIIGSIAALVMYMIGIPGRILGSFAALAMFFITLPLRLLGSLINLLVFIIAIPGRILGLLLAPFRALSLVFFSLRMAIIQVGMLLKVIFVGIYTAAVAVFSTLFPVMAWPFVALWRLASILMVTTVLVFKAIALAVVIGAVAVASFIKMITVAILAFSLLVVGNIHFMVLTVGNWIRTMFAKLAGAILVLFEFAVVAGVYALVGIVDFIRNIGTHLSALFGVIRRVIWTIVSSIASAVVSLVTTIIPFIIQAVLTFVMLLPVIALVGSVIATIGLGVFQLFSKIKDSIGSVKNLAGDFSVGVAEAANNAAHAAISMWDSVKGAVADNLDSIINFFRLLAGFFWNWRDNMSIIWAWLKVNWREVAFDIGKGMATVLENLAHNIKETFLLIMRLGGTAIMFIFNQFLELGGVISFWFKGEWKNIGHDIKLVMSAVFQSLFHNFMVLFRALGTASKAVGWGLAMSVGGAMDKLIYKAEYAAGTITKKQMQKGIAGVDKFVEGEKSIDTDKIMKDLFKELKGPGDFLDPDKLKTNLTGPAGIFGHLGVFFKSILPENFRDMGKAMGKLFTGTPDTIVPAVPKKLIRGTPEIIETTYSHETGKYTRTTTPAVPDRYTPAIPEHVVPGENSFLQKLNPLLKGFEPTAKWGELMKSLKLDLPKNLLEQIEEKWTRFMKPQMEKGEEAGQQFGKQGPGFQFKQISLARTMLGGEANLSLDFQQLVTLRSIDKNVALIAASRGGLKFPTTPGGGPPEPLVGP